MERKLDPKEIAALRAQGFYVAPVAGQGDERYAWGNSQSGARQKDTRQPARRSEAQAWYDCNEYAGDGDAGPARPDWLDVGARARQRQISSADMADITNDHWIVLPHCSIMHLSPLLSPPRK